MAVRWLRAYQDDFARAAQEGFDEPFARRARAIARYHDASQIARHAASRSWIRPQPGD